MVNWKNLSYRALRWLYPGLKIKRWILLAAFGLCLTLFGLSLLVGPKLFQSGRELTAVLEQLRGTVYIVLILAGGLFVLFLGLKRATLAAGEARSFNPQKPFIDALFKKRYLESGPRIVTIGGGTGLSVLLRELKNYTANLTAVVTVADDGGSSGRLRQELGMLPPGDIRSCLLAMADTELLMERLFDHRFTGGIGLEGHSFGNLFIAAMTELFGFQEAVKQFGKVLAIRGRVFPVTLEMVRLESEDCEGRIYHGESVLEGSDGSIRRIALNPPDVKPLPDVLSAIAEADAIILGPGSLFTSIIPNLLVPGIVDALSLTAAPKFYVCNVMTQAGETRGFSAAGHLQALIEHSREGIIDCAIVNSDLTVPGENLEPFLRRGSSLVRPDYRRLRELTPRMISAPLINRDFPTRHNGRHLARLIVDHVINQIIDKRDASLEGRLYHLNHRLRRRMGGIGE